MITHGIDVSHHNGKIDWAKVKNAGNDFAFIRIGWSGYEGEIHLDKTFYENFDSAVKAGVKVGIYVYSYNKNEESARKTADEIEKLLMGRNLQFPIAFDIEETTQKVFASKSKKENSAICRAFLEAVEAKGYKAILYSYTAFILQYLDIEALSDFDLWIADYRDESGSKCPYEGKKRIWQFKGDKGRCDGVSGACDLNICFRDYPNEEAEETVDYKEKYNDLKSKLEDILNKA